MRYEIKLLSFPQYFCKEIIGLLIRRIKLLPVKITF